jgi:hypothetical protein
MQETKAQSFISRHIHNLKIVFLDPTIRTAELFPKAIILNAKSLDRNCSSIMLRRGTITRILVGHEQTLRISSANRKLFPNPVGRTARNPLNCKCLFHFKDQPFFCKLVVRLSTTYVSIFVSSRCHLYS